jgi:hypothetical protein
VLEMRLTVWSFLLIVMSDEAYPCYPCSILVMSECLLIVICYYESMIIV